MDGHRSAWAMDIGVIGLLGGSGEAFWKDGWQVFVTRVETGRDPMQHVAGLLSDGRMEGIGVS